MEQSRDKGLTFVLIFSFYRLEASGKVDNADQRICEDVRVVSSFLSGMLVTA